MVPRPPARRRRGLAIGLSIGAAVMIVAVGVPVLALAVLPLLPRATRRADVQRAS